MGMRLLGASSILAFACVAGSLGCAFDTSNPLAGGATSPTPGALVPPDGGLVPPPEPADDPNPTSPTPDAGIRGPTLSPDASIAAPPPAGTPCWDRPYDFAAPERLDGLSSAEDDADPAFSPDGLRLVFSSKRVSGNWDLWMAERTATDAEFGVPRLLAGYATGASERGATIAPDGQRIYFISDRVESGMQAVDVWTSPFPSGNPTRSTLSTTKDDERVLVSGDDHVALVSADKLYATVRMSTSQPWSTPSLQVMLSGCGGCRASALSPDGKTLLVTRKVRYMGGPGGGDDEDQSDLAIVTRSDVFSPFDAPRAIGGVNDARADDEDGVLSPDGCWLYFASDRGGNADLYRAQRR